MEAYSYFDINALPTIHVVNVTWDDFKGWVMVAADTRVEPVLAFGTNGHRTPDDAKLPGIQSHQASAVNEVESVRLQNADIVPYDLGELAMRMCFDPNNEACPGGNDDPCLYSDRTFGPLLTTTWGQDCPYNRRITVGGCSDRCGQPRPPTGCIATAIAQVVNYHRRPNGFAYPSMIPVYDDLNANHIAIASSASNVADLMSFIGNDVNMRYRCDDSWAMPWEITRTFGNFGYASPGTRDVITYDRIGDEIRFGRPVIAEGRERTLSGWHVWVIDGYRVLVSSDCRKYQWVNMNWGWNGRSNGWYRNGDYNPRGSANGPYDDNNKFIYGIRP